MSLSNSWRFFGALSVLLKAQGVSAGAFYGLMSWAYYPDRYAFAHKNTVLPAPTRGMAWLNQTTFRPAVTFSLVNLTFASVESFMEEIKGSHQKDPWNATVAGAAAGIVLGGMTTRRFDIATATGFGLGLLMGLVELNGSNIICDPEHEYARHFPPSMPAKFEESELLSELKEKYPAYKYN